jgi:hypothetical protein
MAKKTPKPKPVKIQMVPYMGKPKEGRVEVMADNETTRTAYPSGLPVWDKMPREDKYKAGGMVRRGYGKARGA